MTEPRGLYVGIGVSRYGRPDLPELKSARDDVSALRDLLGEELAGQPLIDPDEDSANRHLRTVRLPEGGTLVLVWAGHGTVDATGLRLLTAEEESEGISVTEVARKAVRSGASQLLMVFDTCYSGAAAERVSSVATRLLEELPPEGTQVWVGVLTSCLAYETARDGLLGGRLRALLADGPADRDVRLLYWSVHRPLVSGYDLCDALIREWNSEEQRPVFLPRGVALGMFRNPLHDPAAPPQVVEHLLRAARGGAVEDERSWFTGRTSEVDRVVGWVRSRVMGIRLVTGPAGTGKSAIVGRVVSASVPAERDFLLRDGRTLGHTDPGQGAIDAHIHARGLTADQAAEALDAQLVGVEDGLLRLEEGRRNAAELVGAVQRRATRGDHRPFVFVVDGLDEARSQAFDITTELVGRLAPYACLVVASRELRAPGRDLSLLDELSAVEVLDLDDPDVRASGRAALRQYVIDRLAGIPIMDAEMVADHLAGATHA